MLNANILDQLHTVSVLCIGDIMLDTYAFGSVERISPEAPVPVLRVRKQQDVLGGAGNVLRNLSHLGVQSFFHGIIGNDVTGQHVHQLLKELSNTSITVSIDPHMTTPKKTRYISHQHLLRVDYEAPELPITWAPEFWTALEQTLPKVQAVILSDYAKGLLSFGVTQNVIRLCKKHGLLVVVDPKGKDWSKYKGAALITPNRQEFFEFLGAKIDKTEAQNTMTALREGALKAIEMLDLEGILITLGADGMYYVGKDGQSFHEHSVAQEVYDVSGAGDTVISVLASALATRCSMHEAAFLANIAAGCVVAKVGTAPIYQDELRLALEEQTTPLQTRASSKTKVMTIPLLLEALAQEKKNQCIVGFTNGCFDLLHRGHLTLLQEAKNQCDVLVVALNTDQSVSRLKGPSRPVQDQKTRAAVLEALQWVDYVVLFDDPTPLELIQALLPNVLIKGADYTVDQVVGSRDVIAAGGRVHLVHLLPDHSTTKTVERMARESV